MYHGWRLLRLKGNELLWLHHWRWDDLGGNTNLYYAFGMGEELVGILNWIWDLGFGILALDTTHCMSFVSLFFLHRHPPQGSGRGRGSLCSLCEFM